MTCGNTSRFEERYVVARRGLTLREPAWVCRRCGAEVFVRHNGGALTHSVIERRRALAAASPRSASVRRDGLRELRRVLAEIRAEAQRRPVVARRRTPGFLAHLADMQFVSVVAADEAARIVEANPAACALTGRSHTQLVKMRVGDLFHEQPARFERAWHRFVESGEFSGACRLRQGSGLLVTVECVASAHVMPGVHVGTLASRRLLQSLA